MSAEYRAVHAGFGYNASLNSEAKSYNDEVANNPFSPSDARLLDESAHNYKTYLVKAGASFIDKHHIWRRRTFGRILCGARVGTTNPAIQISEVPSDVRKDSDCL